MFLDDHERIVKLDHLFMDSVRIEAETTGNEITFRGHFGRENYVIGRFRCLIIRAHEQVQRPRYMFVCR